ncbi:MAG: hypothetical protein DIJKHBIC_04761 [Thermoanaerobaculia bacterium]|nr:hypothetical protein [Thermoanaerobaculia bacterium]
MLLGPSKLVAGATISAPRVEDCTAASRSCGPSGPRKGFSRSSNLSRSWPWTTGRGLMDCSGGETSNRTAVLIPRKTPSPWPPAARAVEPQARASGRSATNISQDLFTILSSRRCRPDDTFTAVNWLRSVASSEPLAKDPPRRSLSKGERRVNRRALLLVFPGHSPRSHRRNEVSRRRGRRPVRSSRHSPPSRSLCRGMNPPATFLRWLRRVRELAFVRPFSGPARGHPPKGFSTLSVPKTRPS